MKTSRLSDFLQVRSPRKTDVTVVIWLCVSQFKTGGKWPGVGVTSVFFFFEILKFTRGEQEIWLTSDPLTHVGCVTVETFLTF